MERIVQSSSPARPAHDVRPSRFTTLPGDQHDVPGHAHPPPLRAGESATAHSTSQRYARIGRAAITAYCLLVGVLGGAAGILAALDEPLVRGVDGRRLLVVALLAVGSLVLGWVSEQRRRVRFTGPAWDVHSTWLLTAAVVLPVRATVLLSLVLLVHALLVRRATASRAGLYWGAGVLGVLAARAAVGWDVPGLGAPRLLLAALVLLVVQSGLVVLLARVVQVPGSWRAAAGEPAGVLAELSCLAVGVLLVGAVVQDPWFAVAAVPALLLVEASSHVPTLRRTAELDVKTGLQSTVHWQNQAADRLGQARSRGRAAAVVLLDVDRFKTVNDSVGHVAGDAVLAAVARAAAGQLRSGDVIGRFGGDEIVALLVSATVEQAQVVGDRMRSAVSELAVLTRGVDGAALRVDGLTVSVGVAGTDAVGHELADLLLAADGALLQAKRTGRNRVCTS